MSETEALDLVKSIVKNYTNVFDCLIIERENLNAVSHTAKIAVRMNTKDVNENLIRDLKYQKYRLDKKISFEGSRVDINSDLETTFLFLDAEIKVDI